MRIGFSFYANELTWNSSAIIENDKTFAEQEFQATTNEMSFISSVVPRNDTHSFGGVFFKNWRLKNLKALRNRTLRRRGIVTFILSVVTLISSLYTKPTKSLRSHFIYRRFANSCNWQAIAECFCRCFYGRVIAI